ncbi:MarR family transcriptional regulator [Roseibium aquae]|uniref:MarR family transcriptional regulator n=1 Tax=Roseibium aquae TaxID=1323746 RepID=A0A916TF36_9HYPH|nr:MarR family winged helix-turn-helix transcriptional regulator [Roseibium aquae]GGB42624.1 MarR family transcriptional regulator [Roseibium aquae]
MNDDEAEAAAPRGEDGQQPAVLSLDGFLPYQLNFLAEQVSRSFSLIYKQQFGIGIPEWRVVAILGEFGRVTSKQVGERSTMHKTKVSRAVAALESRGYVRREPNPQDMRESFIVLTDAGRAMYDELVPQALAFSNRLRTVLEPQENAALEDIITKLHAASSAFNDEQAKSKVARPPR